MDDLPPELPVYDRAGNPISVTEWGRLMDNPDYRIVKHEHVGPYLISTAWLGLDHGWRRSKLPVIFETMVFAHAGASNLGPDIDCRRYYTEEEALRGHEETVLLIRATLQEQPEVSETDSNGR